MMRRIVLSLAALALAAPAVAAETPTKPTPEQLTAADDTLSLIVSALNSKDVPQEMKNGLFGCLYETPLKKISESATAAMAKTKTDKADPTRRLLVVAAVCGIEIKPAGGAKDAAKPAPKSR